MSAADYLSIEQIKAQGSGERMQRLKNNEKYGTKRILQGTIFTATAGFGVNATGDRLFLGHLPRFARVTSVKISNGAMGTGATLSVGTDASTATAPMTQPDYGTGTGTELVNALSVAAASTTPVEGINQISVFDATGLPQTTANDETRIASGLGFENQTGPVAIYATSGGAAYATGEALVIIVEFIAETD